jgi:signal transduction histidine kinase
VMIGVHARDSREMAHAILCVSRRCGTLGARLGLVGAEAGLERIRVEALGIDPSALSGVDFHPVPGPTAVTGHSVDGLAAALREASFGGDRVVGWVAATLPAIGAGDGLRDLAAALGRAAAIPTVLSVAHPDDAGRAALVEACDAVVSARALSPECPRWLLDGSGGALDPAGGALGEAGGGNAATVSQLGAILAHELGNPLSIISSSLQYLRDRLARSNDDASEFASAALGNVERMQVLLRKMLQAGSPGKSTFERASLNELVPELLRLTGPECERRHVRVEVALDGRIPLAWLDPQGVRQVVLNLLKNTLDALSARDGTLRVRTRLDDEAEGMRLEIENDGPPIGPDVLPHLFHPFHSTKEGGTGLGLYLSRQIARDHGGDLVAENLASGVRFTLRLPIDRRRGVDSGERADRG